MSEQQRVNLAIFICLVIFAVYYFVAAPTPEPQKQPQPPTQQQPRADSEQQPRRDSEIQPPAEPRERPEKSAPPKEESTPVDVPEQTLSFETKVLTGELDNRSGGYPKLQLKDYDERTEDNEGARPVSLVWPTRTEQPEPPRGRQQARIEWSGAVDARGGAELERRGDDSLVLRGAGPSGVQRTVRIEPRQNEYALDYTVRVRNDTDASLPVGAKLVLSLRPKEEGGGGSFLVPSADRVHGLCARDGDVERFTAEDLNDDGAFTAAERVGWVALDRQYFVVALLAADGAKPLGCKVRAQDETVLVELVLQEGPVPPGGQWERKLTLFAGPKRSRDLAAVEPQLTEVIDYDLGFIPLGFLARPMVFLMNVFHGWTNSWGVAIILLTFFVKLLLFPVTFKSSLSMRKMQLLRPELERIRKQYENDRERQQLEQMKLFREKGVNPVGGCLPMLLQMPVWIALYRSLWSAVDLYQQSFLWLDDLTARESFPFLAIAFGGLTILQQRLTPMSMDNQQAKVMMYAMPIVFALFMVSLPSGLVLYIVVNSILTIFQQLAINRRQVSL